MLIEQIEAVFGPMRPLKEAQVERLRKLQEGFMVLAQCIVENTPRVIDRERSLDMLKSAYVWAQNAAIHSKPIVTPGTILHLIQKLEKPDKKVVRIWLNTMDFADLCRFGSNHFDPATGEDHKRGFQGKLWGVELWIKRVFPEGYALPISELDGNSDLDPEWIYDPAKLVQL